jgi:hypothetical protein
MSEELNGKACDDCLEGPWNGPNEKGYFVTKEEAQARYDICKTCPELEMPLRRCAKCGCFMKLKTKLRNVSCPLGKW